MGREAESGARRAAGAGGEQPVLMAVRHGAEAEVYDVFICAWKPVATYMPHVMSFY